MFKCKLLEVIKAAIISSFPSFLKYLQHYSLFYHLFFLFHHALFFSLRIQTEIEFTPRQAIYLEPFDKYYRLGRIAVMNSNNLDEVTYCPYVIIKYRRVKKKHLENHAPKSSLKH